MAEMTRGVMDGRIGLRDVARSSVSSEGFRAGFERYRRWEAEQDPVRLRRMVEETRAAMGDDGLGDRAGIAGQSLVGSATAGAL
jgi:hypothetical protein